MAAPTPNAKENEGSEYPNSEVQFYLTTETHLYDRSVLFIGIPGQGKSSLCNFLLRENKFRVQHSLIPDTSNSEQALTEIDGCKFLLVDTPGFISTEGNKAFLAEITKALFFVRKKGISAIGIVINPNEKMHAGEYNILEEFLENLSPNAWGHVFVVFTHEKQSIINYPSGEDYITHVLQRDNCPKFLQLLNQKCERRFMHIECGDKCEDLQFWQHKLKCSELTQFVENIMNENGFLKLRVMEQIDEKISKLQLLQNDKEEGIKIIGSLTDLDEIALINKKIVRTNLKMLDIIQEMKSSFLKWIGLTVAYGALIGVGTALAIAVPPLVPLAGIIIYGLYSKFK